MDGGGYFYPRSAPDSWRMPQVRYQFGLDRTPYWIYPFFLPRWSTQRIVFGKPLTSQGVIRAKLASMISRVEACQNWFESTTYQMNNVSTAFHFDKLIRADADQIRDRWTTASRLISSQVLLVYWSSTVFFLRSIQNPWNLQVCISDWTGNSRRWILFASCRLSIPF